jgi:hypothetical protein
MPVRPAKAWCRSWPLRPIVNISFFAVLSCGSPVRSPAPGQRKSPARGRAWKGPAESLGPSGRGLKAPGEGALHKGEVLRPSMRERVRRFRAAPKEWAAGAAHGGV